MPAALSIRIDPNDLRQATAAFDGTPIRLRRELRIAVSRTLRWSESQMAKQVVTKVRVAQRDVRRVIAVEQRPGEIGGVVRLAKVARIELRDFGARQVGKPRPRGGGDAAGEASRLRTTHRVGARMRRAHPRQVNPGAGVTYQIDREGGRRLLPGGFIVARFGGGVFIRRPGVGRLPIFRVQGIGPWGAYTRNDMLPVLAAGAQERLGREVRERIRAAAFTGARRKGGA